jgi:hypothetical protein
VQNDRCDVSCRNVLRANQGDARNAIATELRLLECSVTGMLGYWNGANRSETVGGLRESASE